MKWISVENELPVENVRVLVCTNWGSIKISSLQKIGWSTGQTVSYWMPLPSAPESVKKKLKRDIGYSVSERNPIRRKDDEHD